MIRIRASLAGDLPFVTELERHPDNRELIGQWTDDEHRAGIEGRERWTHWIVEQDGRQAGFIISRDCREQGAGIYMKRILVRDKDRGIGQAALKAFLDRSRDLYATSDIWLIVRRENLRAQAVYRKLGFEPFEPQGDAARNYDEVAEPPADRAFRMRLAAGFS